MGCLTSRRSPPSLWGPFYRRIRYDTFPKGKQHALRLRCGLLSNSAFTILSPGSSIFADVLGGRFPNSVESACLFLHSIHKYLNSSISLRLPECHQLTTRIFTRIHSQSPNILIFIISALSYLVPLQYSSTILDEYQSQCSPLLYSSQLSSPPPPSSLHHCPPLTSNP